MIGSIALLLLGGAVATTPCEGLSTLKLSNATVTSAIVVPEGPPPGRGGGGGGRGGRRGDQGRGGGGAAPQADTPATPQQAGADIPAPPRGGGGAAGVGQRGAGGRGGGATTTPPAAPPAPIPAHCRVLLDLKPTSDSLIKMELWMPTQNWNGKFMAVGNGLWAGSIQGRSGDMPQALRLGYATAGTDAGHQTGNGLFAVGHPEKLVDFAYRATHEMTLKAKQIVKSFYDESPKYSYFKGCSTGGRMALMAAQRYPNDYDGILAGAMANRHIHMHTAGFIRSVDLARNPEQRLNTEKAALINELVTSTCDANKEGFLNNPRQCKVDFSKLLCPAGKDDATCITPAQMKSVETFYGGTKNTKGQLIFSGQALGNPIGGARGGNQAPGVPDVVRIAFNDTANTFDWKTFDVDRDMPFIDKQIGFVDSVNPDLGKFKSSGGKLLLYHGWGDTTITPETSAWYYDSVLDKMGKNQSNWMRLFMVPAMGHCNGGFAFDQIGTLEKWVEKGIAPDQILGTYGAQQKTRPLCPYPQYAEFKGSGEFNDAANWVCKK